MISLGKHSSNTLGVCKMILTALASAVQYRQEWAYTLSAVALMPSSSKLGEITSFPFFSDLPLGLLLRCKDSVPEQNSRPASAPEPWQELINTPVWAYIYIRRVQATQQINRHCGSPWTLARGSLSMLPAAQRDISHSVPCSPADAAPGKRLAKWNTSTMQFS